MKAAPPLLILTLLLSVPADTTAGAADYGPVTLEAQILLLSREIAGGGERDLIASALNNRGIAYRQSGLYDLAVTDYGRAIDLRPDFAAAYSNRGLAHAKAEHYDVAIRDFDQAIRLDPTNADTYLRRGNARYDSEEYDLAIADYTKAVELRPDLLLAYYNRYTAYEKTGRPNQAGEEYWKIREMDPAFETPKSALRYAICGRRSCVIQEPSPPSRRDPLPVYNPPTLPPQKLPPPETELQKRQRESTRLNNEGVQFHNKDDFDRAIQLYEQALRLDPENKAAKENLNIAMVERALRRGQGHFDKGEYDKAGESYWEALKLEPDNPVAMQKLREINAVYAQRNAQEKMSGIVQDLQQDLATPIGQSSSLEFMGPVETLHSKGSKESAPVGLDFVDPKRPVSVDPGKVKEPGVKFSEVPKPSSEHDPYFNKTRAEIVLGAIDRSRGADKGSPGDWVKSINDLNHYLTKVNPDNVNAQEALSYIEGIYASTYKEDKKSPEPQPDVVSESLMEAIQQARSGQWRGQRYNPERIHVGPNPLNWKQKRDFAIAEALVSGKGDIPASVKLLEKRIKRDPNAPGASAALQFLKGLVGGGQ